MMTGKNDRTAGVRGSTVQGPPFLLAPGGFPTTPSSSVGPSLKASLHLTHCSARKMWGAGPVSTSQATK